MMEQLSGFFLVQPSLPLNSITERLQALGSAYQAHQVTEDAYHQLERKLTGIHVPCQRSYEVLKKAFDRTMGARVSKTAGILARAQLQADRHNSAMAAIGRESRLAAAPQGPFSAGRLPELTCGRSTLQDSGGRFGMSCNFAHPAKQEACVDTFSSSRVVPSLGLHVVSMTQALASEGEASPLRRDSHFARQVTHEVVAQIAACIDALNFKFMTSEVRQAIKAAFNFGWHRQMQLALARHDEAQTSAQEISACHAIAAVVYGDSFYLANLGKNRAYLAKDGCFRQISVDHEQAEPSEQRQRSHFRRTHLQHQRASHDQASRLLLNLEPNQCWRPQVVCLPLADIQGGSVLIVSATLAKNLTVGELEQLSAGPMGSLPPESLGSVLMTREKRLGHQNEAMAMLLRLPSARREEAS